MDKKNPLSKPQPHNPDAEKSVLGSILLENKSILKVIKIIKRTYFYEPRHRIIYKTMLDMFETDELIDLLTLSEFLLKAGKLEEVGGTIYLMDLLEATPTATTIIYHAKIIRDNNLLRKLINVGIQIQLEAQNQNISGIELLKKAEKLIGFHAEQELQSDIQSLDKLMEDFWEEITNNADEENIGLKTEFYDLDKILCGMQNSDLIVCAGRPSMGKTSFALNIGFNVCVQNNHPTAIFSLESSAKQLIIRMISSYIRISSSLIRTGNLSAEQWKKASSAMALLLGSPLFIDDTAGLSVIELKARCRRLKNEHDIKLVIIDYLGLVKSDVKAENKTYETEYIVQAIKNIAKEIDVPIILLSQLNRACESRNPPRPMLPDLRSSGAIEQEADVVMFLYRAEKYAKSEELKRQCEGIAEVIIAKHRDGATGTVKLQFQKEFTKFCNLSNEQTLF